MTIKEASEIYYINKEIERLRKELVEMEEERVFYKPIILSDMPKAHGGYKNPSDDFLNRRYAIEQSIDYALRRLQEKRLEFEFFLKSVDDAEIRLILRLRCVNNLTWEEIGEEMSMDRTTASKKYKAFFKHK